MKRIFSSILFCHVLVFLLFSAAYGDTQVYVRGSIGYSMPDNSTMVFDDGGRYDIAYDDGLAFSLATGSSLRSFRQELEITYQGNDLGKARAPGAVSANLDGDALSVALLYNGYYDFINRTPFTPFVSAGIGLAFVEISDVASPDASYSLKNENDVVFAYQGGAGIGWNVHEKFTIDLAYRYFATLDPDLEIAEMDFSSHNVYLGVRANF